MKKKEPKNPKRAQVDGLHKEIKFSDLMKALGGEDGMKQFLAGAKFAFGPPAPPQKKNRKSVSGPASTGKTLRETSNEQKKETRESQA